MHKPTPGGRLPLLFLILAAAGGCTRSQGQNGGAPPAPPPPVVEVSLPVTRDVTDYEDFPGRTEAVNAIEVRARVTGYLSKVYFKEGTDVHEGDVLVEIDPRPYQAEVDRTEANLVQSQAHLRRTETDFERANRLLHQGAVSKEEYDRIAGDRAEAAAAVGVARANRDLALLNLSFTKVRCPIDGRISRRFIDPGNLVKADETALTMLVSLDPMYAYFDVDERTALRLRRLMREGKVQWSPDAGLPVSLGLADEAGHPRQGTVNFADNRVDPDTGTWRLRGLFANADGALTPGLFVRIRLPLGQPYRALLVPEQALGTDQGQKFVYVVGADKKVQNRQVKVGRIHDGLRVIQEGIKPDEQVIVSGLQRVRQGVEVNPKPAELPK